MSRIGKQPIPLPSGVEVSVGGSEVTVKGPKGELSLVPHPAMGIEIDDDPSQLRVTRPDDSRANRSLHGLTRSLINNMVTGVVTPYEKQLEIHGVGYQAILDGNTLNLSVGFANMVKLSLPSGVQCELTSPTLVKVSGCDKQAVGQFAADIRAVRPPEPYKGKGIRYRDEHVRRKQGKAFASAGA
jgi:large subunit ribosomal protein L6